MRSGDSTNDFNEQLDFNGTHEFRWEQRSKDGPSRVEAILAARAFVESPGEARPSVTTCACGGSGIG